jgi:hypothetical protein
MATGSSQVINNIASYAVRNAGLKGTHAGISTVVRAANWPWLMTRYTPSIGQTVRLIATNRRNGPICRRVNLTFEEHIEPFNELSHVDPVMPSANVDVKQPRVQVSW